MICYGVSLTYLSVKCNTCLSKGGEGAGPEINTQTHRPLNKPQHPCNRWSMPLCYGSFITDGSYLAP